MKKHVVALSAASLLCLGAPVLADHHEGGDYAKDQAAMTEAWMKAATPGEQHSRLAKWAGTWNTKTTNYEMGQASEPTTGTATFEVMLGGRLVQGKHTGTMFGQPFEGVSMDGYDNITGKYWATWLDSMATQLYVMRGTDTGPHIAYRGHMTMPNGQKADMRFDMVYEGDDKAVMKMYMKSDEMPEEMLTMVMEYTRASS